MTIAQLVAQLLWLLDQRANVYESFASDGVERLYLHPDGVTQITQGDHLARLDARISGTRSALVDRREIFSTLNPPPPAEV